jgi:hypothetical protein
MVRAEVSVTKCPSGGRGRRRLPVHRACYIGPVTTDSWLFSCGTTLSDGMSVACPASRLRWDRRRSVNRPASRPCDPIPWPVGR